MKPGNEDTIAAIATPAGVGGVGIIRLSGGQSVAIADVLFRADSGVSLVAAQSHRFFHGWVYREGEPLDEVLAVVMRAPRSYTREDVVEIHCHGGQLVLRTVLEMAMEKGARLAAPGEFTQRAFFNGRIDLTRVEAVADIVRSRSLAGLKMTANQLRGRLYEAITGMKGELLDVAALTAAGIDFPEEDIVFAHRDEINERLVACRDRLKRLEDTAEKGRILRDGIYTAIVGRPNVGKSSLLNALLREERAIVTDVPGTTRDTVEESAEVGGIVLNLVDTAGIRETGDQVERMGIDRSLQAMERAELVLLLLDGAESLVADDRSLLERARPENTLVVINKRDRMNTATPEWMAQLEPHRPILLSATTGEGMAELENRVRQWAFSDDRSESEDALLTNLRQKQAAVRAREAVETALEGMADQRGDELLAVDLQQALDALGEIVGETTADDMMNRIFEEFCIGK